MLHHDSHKVPKYAGNPAKKSLSQEFPAMKKSQEGTIHQLSKSHKNPEVVMEESMQTPMTPTSIIRSRPKTSHTKKADSFPVIGSVISADLDPHGALLQPDNRTNPQLMMLEGKYLEARQRFESYRLPAPIILLSRNQHDKCARLYYAMYTLLQSSISASQADKLERYIRLKSSLFPASMFDLLEWEDALRVSRMVRTHELTDARIKLMSQSKELGNQLKHSSVTLRSIVAEVNDFKHTVGQGIADVKLFMEEVQSMVLNIVTTFAAKQDGMIGSLEASNSDLLRELRNENDKVIQLEENAEQMEAQITAMKQKQSSLVTRLAELTTSEASLIRRNEELEDKVEEITKKGARAARVAVLAMTEKESELSQAKSETVLAHEETKKITLALEQMTIAQHSTQKQLEQVKSQSSRQSLQFKTTIETLQQEAEVAKANYESLSESKKKDNEQFQQQKKVFEEQQAAWTAESDLLVIKERGYGKLALQELESTIQELNRELSEERAKTSRLAALEEEVAMLRAIKQSTAETMVDTMSVGASVSTATVLPQWNNSTPVKDDHRDHDPNGATATLSSSSCANTDHDSIDHHDFIPLPSLAGDSTRGGLSTGSPTDDDKRERSSVGKMLSAVKSDAATSSGRQSPSSAPQTSAATATTTTTDTKLASPLPSVEGESASKQVTTGNTTNADTTSVIGVDTTSVTNTTKVPFAADTSSSSSSAKKGVAGAAGQEGLVGNEGGVVSTAPVVTFAAEVTMSGEVSLSDGSDISLGEGSASASAPSRGERDQRDGALTSSVTVVGSSSNDPINNDGVAGDVAVAGGVTFVDAVVTTAAALDSATTAEAESGAESVKNGEKKVVPNRRDTMMAVAGEEGVVDDGIVLSELEDRFLTSVAYNKQSVVEECLKQDKSLVHIKNGFGRDAIQIASRNGNIALMEYLHKQGASLATVGNNNDTLFHLAAFNGQFKVIRWLVKMGAKDVAKMMDSKQRTVMHVAGKRGELEILQYLQEQVGFDLRLQDCEGQSVLGCIPRFGDDKERCDLCRSFVQDICRSLDAADRSREEVRSKIKK